MSRTISSPGVEIREFDRSARVAPQAGTTVYVTGFADQGPTDQSLSISSLSEFQSIYGPPKNSAERYFYHTVKALFNSPANILVNRLPYGVDSGVGFGSSYTALVYPVRMYNPALVVQGVQQQSQATFNYSVTGATSLSATALAIQTGTSTYVFTWSASSVYSAAVTALTSWVSGLPNGNVIRFTSAPVTTTAQLMTSAYNYLIALNTFSNIISTGNTLTFTESAAGALTYSISGLGGITGNTLLSGVNANNGVTSNLNAVSGIYFLGKPKQFSLNRTQYQALADGTGFSWSPNASSVNDMGQVSTLGGAGLIVLNKSQTTIDQKYQGYYLGIADNVDADNIGSNFNKITSVLTVTTSAVGGLTNYLTIPTSNLTFALTSSSTQRINSISEQLETASKGYTIGNNINYDDTLNIGVYKLRQGVLQNDAKLLIADRQEVYTGSLTDANRQFASTTGGPAVSYYLGNQINNYSPNINILVNSYINNTASDSVGRGTSYNTSDPNITLKKVRVINQAVNNNFATLGSNIGMNITQDALNAITTSVGYADSLLPIGTFSDEGFTSKVIGNVPAKVRRALDIVRNDELYDLSVVVEAGLGTVHAYTTVGLVSSFDATAYNATYQTELEKLQVTTTVQTNSVRDAYMAVLTEFTTFANTYQNGGRGDTFLVADPIRHLYVAGANSKVIEQPNKTFAQHIYWGTRNQFDFVDSSYVGVYANWIKVSDDFTGQPVWVPSSGFAAARMAATDSLVGPWEAPAGFNRGVLGGAIDIAFAPNQRQRDDLYKIALNPITTFPGQGIVVFGQKTLQKKPSAFDRINVRRLFLAMEKNVKNTIKYFVFEPNTKYTRDRVKATLDPYFQSIQAAGGLYDFLVVCDQRNNTAEVIDNNELVVDLYFKPVRTSEFILVNFYATRTDTNFSELVGKA